MTEWQRPLPRPDNVTGPYWEAAARGELLIQRCPACGHRQFYPRALCTACGHGGGTDSDSTTPLVLTSPRALNATAAPLLPPYGRHMSPCQPPPTFRP